MPGSKPVTMAIRSFVGSWVKPPSGLGGVSVDLESISLTGHAKEAQLYNCCPRTPTFDPKYVFIAAIAWMLLPAHQPGTRIQGAVHGHEDSAGPGHVVATLFHAALTHYW
jgi:hypothetical protein